MSLLRDQIARAKGVTARLRTVLHILKPRVPFDIPGAVPRLSVFAKFPSVRSKIAGFGARATTPPIDDEKRGADPFKVLLAARRYSYRTSPSRRRDVTPLAHCTATTITKSNIGRNTTVPFFGAVFCLAGVFENVTCVATIRCFHCVR